MEQLLNTKKHISQESYYANDETINLKGGIKWRHIIKQ